MSEPDRTLTRPSAQPHLTRPRRLARVPSTTGLAGTRWMCTLVKMAASLIPNPNPNPHLNLNLTQVRGRACLAMRGRTRTRIRLRQFVRHHLITGSLTISRPIAPGASNERALTVAPTHSLLRSFTLFDYPIFHYKSANFKRSSFSRIEASNPQTLSAHPSHESKPQIRGL